MGSRRTHTSRAHPRGADIAELDAGRVGKVTFPVPEDLTNMELMVSPDQGLWKGASFKFSIRVPDMYPHEPPKVSGGSALQASAMVTTLTAVMGH